MKKEFFTNATIFYDNCGEPKHIFCTPKDFTKTLNLLKRCSWITDIEVIKYDLRNM
jgi:hypothetical protein